MYLAVYLPLLAPVVAALFAGRPARGLGPRLATWLLACSAVVLAAAAGIVLAVLTVAGLVRIPFVAHLARLSSENHATIAAAALALTPLAVRLVTSAVQRLRTGPLRRLRLTPTAPRPSGDTGRWFSRGRSRRRRS